MKTLCLLGSPRRGGNSDTLAESFLQQASAYGAETEVAVLSDLRYNGCINLLECKTGSNHCGQRDDLTPELHAIAHSIGGSAFTASLVSSSLLLHCVLR